MDFIKLMNEEIDESSSMESLFDSCRLLYGMRDFVGIRDYCVPRWKDKARRLIPSWDSLKVVAVDVNCIFHERHDLSPDDAVSELRGLYTELSPSVFVVCADYTPQPANIVATLDTLRAKICIEQHAGARSIDCLASIALQCSLLGPKCVMVADDRKLWQCLYAGVAMYDKKTKAYTNHDWLQATHRIKRHQVPDWMMMAKSVGETEASNRLQAYGDYIGTINHLREGELTNSYWEDKASYQVNVGTPVRWFLWTKDNK